VGQVLLYDKRDSPKDPTEGYYFQLATDIAGLGGNVRYLRSVVTGGYFHPFAPQWVLSLLGEAGNITGINDTVRIEDRFFVGGDNLRGFATSGIGPRDRQTGDALGGRTYYTGTVQLGFPVGLPPELGITGRVFTDFGSLFSPVEPGIADTRSLRVASGAGVSWASPLGPIRLDLGIPLVRQSFDKKELFRVSFGTRF
jgi:outer membrane protein insertion porin family